MQDLKFRCSSLSNVANGKVGLTEIQQKELDKLLNKIKITDIQAKKRDELIAKRDADVTLTKTGESAVKLLVKEAVYGFDSFFTNKYVQKGTRMEDKAIELLNLHRNTNYVKNEKFISNDYICGTPDIIDEVNEKIIDIKCSWSKATFPLFSEEAHNVDYEFQMYGYLWLMGYKKAEVIYCLVTTPDDLISYNTSGDRVYTEPLDIHQMDDLDLNLRFTSITYTLTPEIIEQIKAKVKCAREYALYVYNNLMMK